MLKKSLIHNNKHHPSKHTFLVETDRKLVAISHSCVKYLVLISSRDRKGEFIKENYRHVLYITLNSV